MTPASFHPKKCQKVGGGEADAVAMGPDSAAGQAGQGQGQLPQQMTGSPDAVYDAGAGADGSHCNWDPCHVHHGDSVSWQDCSPVRAQQGEEDSCAASQAAA